MRDLVADLVEAAYEAVISLSRVLCPARPARTSRRILSRRPSAPSRSIVHTVTSSRRSWTETESLGSSSLETKPCSPPPPGPVVRSAATVPPATTPPAKQQRQKKVTFYLSSGYREPGIAYVGRRLETHAHGRGIARCSVAAGADIGLRMEPTRSTMLPIPRPASYRQGEPREARDRRPHRGNPERFLPSVQNGRRYLAELPGLVKNGRLPISTRTVPLGLPRRLFL